MSGLRENVNRVLETATIDLFKQQLGLVRVGEGNTVVDQELRKATLFDYETI